MLSLEVAVAGRPANAAAPTRIIRPKGRWYDTVDVFDGPVLRIDAIPILSMIISPSIGLVRRDWVEEAR